MSDERRRRVFSILQEVMGLTAAEQAAYLDEACAGDPSLRTEVEDILLAQRDMPEEFLHPPDDTAVLPGKLGEFELEEEIGRGAMGVVWRARQPSLDRTVAVKILTVRLLTTPHQIERFHREARAAALLDHPHIVKVYATGEEERQHWFAMEWVDGHDLETELKQQRSEEPDRGDRCLLPTRGQDQHIARVAALIADVADALDHAHRHGIVHRDVKPSNLVLEKNGEVKVTDFGIARDERFGSLTLTNQLIGSLPYMSPEQARVLEAHVDRRTDVYSLGVVLYELLSLRRPFQGKTSHEILAEIRTHSYPPLRELNSAVPRDLALICDQSMRPKPQNRYASAAAFAADLRRFLAHEAVEATPLPFAQRVAERLRRHRTAVIASTLTVLGLLGGAWVSAAVSENRAVARSREPLVAWEQRDDWTRADTTELLELHEDLRDARDSWATATEDQALVEELQSRLDGERERRTLAARDQSIQGLRDIGAGIGDGQDRLLTGLEALFHVELLGAELNARALYLPKVTIRAIAADGRPLAGSARMRILDPVTGEPGAHEELGTLPTLEFTVPPVPVRFAVQLSGGEVREFHRVPALGEEIEIVVGPAHGSEDGDMVLVEGDTWTLVDPEPTLNPLQGRELRVRPFLLDRTEVSIGQYREFLAAVPDAERPFYFDLLEPGSPHESHPVVLVSWMGARRYAEWRGKRLPTHAEWTLAARGTEGRITPWGADDPAALDSEGERIGNVHETEELTGDMQHRFQQFLRLARAVSSDSKAQTNGICHLFGNVEEWTETVLAMNDAGGTLRPFSSRRIVVGHRWDAVKFGLDLRRIGEDETGPSYARITRGFRCARPTEF